MSNITRSSVMNTHDAKGTGENFFTGSVQTGQQTFDPYVSGFAFIVWLKVPTWLSDPAEFKELTQKNFKSFQGHQNIDLETQGTTMGFTANETHYTKAIGTKSAEFTLKHQEHSGSPQTPIYNEWVSGIRDPKTGIATYPAKAGIEYHSSNHTGTLLYVVTRPDANNFDGVGGNIEFASLWTHVQPKRINLEHFNYEQGQHDFHDLDMPYSGYMNIGPEVEEFARAYVPSRVHKFYTEGSFDNMSSVYTAGS